MIMKSILLIFFTFIFSVSIYTQTVAHPWHVVDRGGGKSSSGNFLHQASIGQANITRMVYPDSGLTFEGGYIPGLRMYSGTFVVFNHQFLGGWNLVSLPLIVGDPRKTTLYSHASSDAFTYTTSYVEMDTILNGKGFWLKYPTTISEVITGIAFNLDTIDVKAGWNLIGVPTYIVPVANIIPIGTTVITEYFGYDNGYYAVDTLLPGNGYWIKTADDGQLVLMCNMYLTSPINDKSPLALGSKLSSPKNRISVLEKDPAMNKIIIKDRLEREGVLYFSTNIKNFDLTKYELPPPPPTDVFDVRFKTNRLVEIGGEDQDKTTSILISSAEFPLILTWEVSGEAGNACLIINGEEIKLVREGSISIAELKSMPKLHMKSSSISELPKEFTLYQNYPNPFNPITKIKYDLPKDSRVTLTIYNIIGQVVEILVDQMEMAGYKIVEWNAENIPSGVYVCKLCAESEGRSVSFVKKLIVMK